MNEEQEKKGLYHGMVHNDEKLYKYYKILEFVRCLYLYFSIQK
jgi:hypothetical protein